MTHMTHLHFCLVVTPLILCHALFYVHDTHDTFTKKSRSWRHAPLLVVWQNMEVY